MNVDDFIWLPSIVDKLESKHGVMPDEAEEVLSPVARIRGLKPETLVNLWLAERLQETT